MQTGYLPQDIITKLSLFAQKASIDSKQISDLIYSYFRSSLVANMNSADRYYLSQHDIVNKQRTYYVDRQKEVDIVSANNRASNPFFEILVDQKVSKIAGKPVSVTVSGAGNRKEPDKEADKFQELLLKQLGVNFDDKVEDWLVGASKHSVDWMHFYIDPKGDLRYIVCPAQQIIPVYDMEYEDTLLQVIRYYQFDYINERGDLKKLYKVEIWSDKDVTYWTQLEDETFVLDFSYGLNPMPHWITENESLSTKEAHGWGKVPFVPLHNNSKGTNDLDSIKALIDVYDRVYNGWADDVEDFSEQILVVKNLAIKDREFYKGMTELNLFMKNLKESRLITIDGEGDVKNIRSEIPVEAKDMLLKITREAIFYFGQGVDVSSEKFGSSPSGVALQHLYALLDMKCNRTALKLQKALQGFFWFVTEYINNVNGTKFDPHNIVVTLNQSMIFNKAEIIDSIINRPYLSVKTKLSLDPDVEDVEEELERIEAEKGDTKNTPDNVNNDPDKAKENLETKQAP